MSVLKPVGPTSLTNGNQQMLNRDQLLELFSLTNHRNLTRGNPENLITQSNWPMLQRQWQEIAGIEFPAKLELSFGDNIWPLLDHRTNLCNQERTPAHAYVCYDTCSRVAQMAGICTLRDWFERIPKGFRHFEIALPGDPSKSYKEAWKGWGDFLGTARKSTSAIRKQKLNYHDSRKFIQAYGITTVREYRDFLDTPAADPRLPRRPDDFYSDNGWVSWADFLVPRFVSYQDAKALMKPFGLRTEADFRKLGKKGRPEGVPSLPYVFYENEFESWADFLGFEGEIRYRKRK